MILWQNCFGNKPDGLAPAPRYLARLAVTLALGIATFALYFRVLAGSLLHEPAPEPPPPAERAAVKS